ncbi:flavin reductase family protein [Nocardia mexicana]|uniref:Flavin reductase (DIM6/NTAB) family NADH-FMN oxidoreductase RutF n=1 Tax=Nocardia mexicana TaxID=279262 RepID=A0A370H2Z6_9NOCA|nr:flavin reductase family protein [Nocardia mexicana]RDI49427.1 flavin reductase (DIM6/NTAB) family NADH-FMN oxidoreductase RutF [Nocardia mexicana]
MVDRNAQGRRFREVMGHFPTGVAIVTTLRDGVPSGMAANSFVSVSLDPPLVSFCPAAGSATWHDIRATGRFCVNFLHSDQAELCRRFATRGGDRFEAVSWTRTGGGAPRLGGAVAWIDCTLERGVTAGDHVIVLGLVRDLGVAADTAPLVFFRGGYHGLAAPSS